MDDFAALESELSEAAKIGNIDHVIGLLRDLGNLHHLWKVPPIRIPPIGFTVGDSHFRPSSLSIGRLGIYLAPSLTWTACQPNPAQVVAIERAAEKCLRRGGSAEVIQPQDLQNPDATPEPATEAVRRRSASLSAASPPPSPRAPRRPLLAAEHTARIARCAPTPRRRAAAGRG
jgi:hypothetical protein